MQTPPQFRLLNIICGLTVFVISALVYILTLEPTASFWDCGEYIACAWGLESGHPPGAPFFLILGRAFGLLSFGNTENVAWMINLMSGLASAATVMFLFWTITHFAKKIVMRRIQPVTSSEVEKSQAGASHDHRFSQGRMVLIMLAGMCGSLMYAFSDSFWFSAVEGEVYALSSLFTAIVFWAMLKWEEQADDVHSDRWIVLIAALIGMSIGVHLLNLLTIPALVFIWYFRKHKPSWRGVGKTFLIALVLLGGIQDVLIPGIVKLAGKSELFFVNSLGMGFNSGIIAFFIFLVALIAFGIWYSVKKKIRWLNTAVLSFMVLLLGYSSFLVIVIRANAGTPINENNPSDPVSLLSYLNREQYGDWPLLYGPQFNTPYDSEQPWVDGNPVYVKDETSGKYIISDARKNSEPNYDWKGCVLFPRMYSSGHTSAYKNWVNNFKGDPTPFVDAEGNTTVVNIPTFSENMRFFVSYQVGWMYLRYFMWNFVGKQNDFAGYGGDAEGNWRSGIGFMDDLRIGDHEIEPALLKNNKGRNGYFFLPFLLGLIGMISHFSTSKRDAVITTLLFLFTGLAIVFYLNQTPWQPRERDYAYVGSFYAFAIWVGLGVMTVYDLKKYISRAVALSAAVVLSGVVPVVVLAQNWDDHNRSHRTVGRDLAISMLESCDKNAVLFTYADNDTFPLWYAQEVLGIRRDVRIICLSLFRSDWYIDQAKKKQYDSDPLPITMDHWQYREGTRDWLSIDDSGDTLLLENVVTFFSSEDLQYKYETVSGDTVNYIPARWVTIPAANEEGSITWAIPGSYILKDQMIILDILAHNEWKRPVHFAVNMPMSCYGGLDNYLQLEGLTYKLVPTFNMRENADLTENPQVNLEKSYDLFMKKFSWGGLENEDVYADETTQRMFSDPYRYSCAVTAHALAESGMNEQAAGLVRLCTQKIPATQILPDDYWISLTDAAWMSGDNELANSLADQAFTHFMQCIKWYRTLPKPSGDMGFKIQQVQLLYALAVDYGEMELAQRWEKEMERNGVPVE